MYDEIQKQLLAAIREGDSCRFRSKIREIQQTGEDEEIYLDPCLLVAGQFGNLEIIRIVYEEFGHPYMGVEECYPNCAGETPFLLACAGGHIATAKYLLEHGTNPFAVDAHGCNAVFNAVCSGNVELTRFLIETCKIAWQGFTWEGTSAIQFAEKCGNPAMYEYIAALGGICFTNPPYKPNL